MKVPLLDGPKHYGFDNRPICRVRASVPFYLSNRGSRTHRVKRATLRRGGLIFPDGPPHRLAVELWCGQTGSWPTHGMINAEPNVNLPLCGKCEALATATGEPRAVQLVPTEIAMALTFVQPQTKGT